MRFEVLRVDPTGARRGRLHTPHGTVETPAFMPVGTQGSVKGLMPAELREVGAEMILGNTYHLYLRPGARVVGEAGGLAAFSAWNGPTLTDSGGFQVMSLGPLTEVREEGVLFRSHLDGSPHLFTPEGVMEIEQQLGADVAMAFDQCPPFPAPREMVEEMTARTHRWAERCRLSHAGKGQALFGIVQGGIHTDLRCWSLREIAAMGFDGIALGGLSVGEPKEEMYRILRELAPELPPDRPHYLMGVGSPDALVEGARQGIDLFDSVYPTRMARHGTLLTRSGRISIRSRRYAEDPLPPDPECECGVCRTFSRRYLRHLFKAGELLALRLATYHNLHVVERLMGEIRSAIEEGRFAAFASAFSWDGPKENPA